MRAPTRIAAPPLVLAALEPAEAEELVALIRRNRDHLANWLPWVDSDPDDVTWRRRWLIEDRRAFDEDRHWSYAIRLATIMIGRCSPHPIDQTAVAVGYWLAADHTAAGYATLAAATLTHLAGHMGFQAVVIRCDTANTASAAIPKRLGHVLDRTEPHAIEAPGHSGTTMIWTKPASPT